MDSQIWVFDNYQMRYGADENYCIDARDMSDGVQLMLWECNGLDQQTWGYDDIAQRVYIDGSSTCLDLWEDQQWNGQWLHVWQCNGLNNQQWSLWDAPAPSGPPPSPPPSPGGGGFFSSCDDQSGGVWPVFSDQSELSNDNQWAQYFACVYGEVPSFGYPICLSGFRMLHLSCVSQAGLNIGQKNLPSSPGDYYMATNPFGFSFGAIQHNDCVGQCFGSNQWFEGLHCSTSAERHSAWYYFTTGSGVWLWSGSTKAWSTRHAFAKDMGFGKCKDFECGGTLFTTAKSQYGYDTIQYLNEHKKQGGGNPMIIATEGVGKNSCGASQTPWMAGWGATQNCDCDQSKACQNCNGFAYNNCGETVVAV